MSTKGQATRLKVVSAARRLFRRNGYANTSIDDICRESGVTRGNLYFYFRSKEELAISAIGDALAHHVPFFERWMEAESDPLLKVEAIIDGIVAFHSERVCKPG